MLRAGPARVTSQLSVAANENAINWDDPHWTSSYHPRHAYSQSKIALGLFGLELDRRSHRAGWGITSNLAHPGVAPTNLLAARLELGRPRDTMGVRAIRLVPAPLRGRDDADRVWRLSEELTGVPFPAVDVARPGR